MGNLTIKPASGGLLKLQDAGSTDRIQITDGGSTVLYEDDGNAALTIDTDGRVHTSEIRASSASGLKLYDDSGTAGIFVEDGGQVGIGTNNPGKTLDVDGQFRVSTGYCILTTGAMIGAESLANRIFTSSVGSVSTTMYIGNASINVTSDKRLKKNIEDSSINAIDKLLKIRIVDFDWDDPSDTSFNNRNARGRWTGFLAQEVVEHIPTMINAPRKEDTLEIDHESEYMWGVDHSSTVPILIKAIQELSAKVEALENA